MGRNGMEKGKGAKKKEVRPLSSSSPGNPISERVAKFTSKKTGFLSINLRISTFELKGEGVLGAVIKPQLPDAQLLIW